MMSGQNTSSIRAESQRGESSTEYQRHLRWVVGFVVVEIFFFGGGFVISLISNGNESSDLVLTSIAAILGAWGVIFGVIGGGLILIVFLHSVIG